MYEQSEYWRGVNNSKARQAWSTFLAAYPWDAFFTSTSSDKSVRRHPISLIGRVRDCICGVVAVERFFGAAEEFRLGDWHCHGLVKWHSGYQNDILTNQALEVGRRLSKIGFCRVEPANSAVAVANYISKYVIKDSPWEYDIAGTGWKLGNPNAVDS